MLKERSKDKVIRKFSIVRKTADCPFCDQKGCSRHSTKVRRLREIGDSAPTELWVTVSVHYCEACRKHFTNDTSYLAEPSSRFTKRVQRVAVEFVTRLGFTLERSSREMWKRHFVRVPPTTLYDWVVAAGRS